LQEFRHDQRGEERAEVDDPVERLEGRLREVLVRLVELVAHEGRDEGLDAARSERDQEQPRVEPGGLVFVDGE
jgi:hypothetical protein